MNIHEILIYKHEDANYKKLTIDTKEDVRT